MGRASAPERETGTRRGTMQHLLRLADEQGVRVVERVGRTRGGYDPVTRTIRLSPGMSARTTRSVLAHELGHACLGHLPAPTPAIRALQERQADEWAASRLITPRAYAEAEEVRGPHLASLAFEMDVTIELVVAYQRLLRQTLLVAG
nr:MULTISPECIES: ImmA/IrrE family metallo-endopeptidase [Microbacterium]